MIELNGVYKSFGEKKVIENLSLSVSRGEKVAILAPSGAGKTTLFRLISGLEKPDKGSVKRECAPAYVFQEPRLFPSATVFENVLAATNGGKREKKSREKTKEKVLSLLCKVGLSNDAERYPSELSGGMAQRVALARALASERELLLLDEPFSGLDTESKEKLIALLKSEAQNKTLLLITHNEEEAKALCGRILTFDGRMQILYDESV